MLRPLDYIEQRVLSDYREHSEWDEEDDILGASPRIAGSGGKAVNQIAGSGICSQAQGAEKL